MRCPTKSGLIPTPLAKRLVSWKRQSWAASPMQYPSVRSLERTLLKWRSEILAYHDTRASHGPTDGQNVVIEKVKRASHGLVKCEHYRLRIRLHARSVERSHRPLLPASVHELRYLNGNNLVLRVTIPRTSAYARTFITTCSSASRALAKGIRC
jgi:hypothetical protein